jgi:hypothetical protein
VGGSAAYSTFGSLWKDTWVSDIKEESLSLRGSFTS